MLKTQHETRGAKISFSDLSNPWQRFRSQASMSQKSLAALLSLSQETISLYEKRQRTPRPATAKAFIELARAKKIRMSLEEIYPT